MKTTTEYRCHSATVDGSSYICSINNPLLLLWNHEQLKNYQDPPNDNRVLELNMYDEIRKTYEHYHDYVVFLKPNWYSPGGEDSMT